MGFSLSWLAVRGKVPHAVRDELGVRPTGHRQEVPDSPVVGAESPAGWYLIVVTPCFASIRDRLRSEHEAARATGRCVDYVFDIPVDVAEALTAFRHDRVIPEMGHTPFEVLKVERKIGIYMTPASRWRRRLAACVILLMGLVLAVAREYAPWPRTAMLVAPAAICFGAVGLVFPAAIPDLAKPELGPFQLWIESGRWQFWVGGAALFVGIIVGVVWAISGV